MDMQMEMDTKQNERKIMSHFKLTAFFLSAHNMNIAETSTHGYCESWMMMIMKFRTRLYMALSIDMLSTCNKTNEMIIFLQLLKIE